MRVSMLTAAALVLAGCGGMEPVVTEREPVTPPAWMLEPCPQTPVVVTTFDSALLMLEMVEAERDECSARLRDVIEWAEDEG